MSDALPSTNATDSAGTAAVERFCIQCGYNLRGLTSRNCPECGTDVELSRLSPIPWQHRRQLGWFRAFWRTLMLGTFQPEKLAKAVEFHLVKSAATWFAFLVLLAASSAVIPWTIAGLYALQGQEFFSSLQNIPSPQLQQMSINYKPLLNGPAWQFVYLWAAGISWILVLPIGVIVMWILRTHWIGWMSRGTAMPEKLADRIPIARLYLCAPLFWLFLPAAAWLVFYYPESNVSNIFYNGVFKFYVSLTTALIPLLCWWNHLRFMRVVSKISRKRLILSALLIPLAWVFALLVGLGVFPFAVGLVRVIIRSLG